MTSIYWKCTFILKKKEEKKHCQSHFLIHYNCVDVESASLFVMAFDSTRLDLTWLYLKQQSNQYKIVLI